MNDKYVPVIRMRTNFQIKKKVKARNQSEKKRYVSQVPAILTSQANSGSVR